ncbi:Similar to mbl: Protein muscleblind (Drosophila melanogaster) [Cotesia congregata]|uniref:Similar to mbl: Protein muscleblind (Drosophila melanogaster) n=1 Tax=Cotesia congregata TaxID=51543 RepID=A0A8J2MSD1_COTCN|nr:Similar to mbl: Protein muscleblind (Drosophila melanogaster) [Cotesia congregata]
MAMVNMNNLLNGKDSRWLQLEVCREFQRNKCTRPDTECKFAHPPANVEVQNGRVTACYDSIKLSGVTHAKGRNERMEHLEWSGGTLKSKGSSPPFTSLQPLYTSPLLFLYTYLHKCLPKKLEARCPSSGSTSFAKPPFPST